MRKYLLIGILIACVAVAWPTMAIGQEDSKCDRYGNNCSSLAVTNNPAQDLYQFRLDPVTYRLLVEATAGGPFTCNQGTAAATAGAWPIILTAGIDIADVNATRLQVLAKQGSAISVGGAWPIQVSDGVDVAGVTAAGYLQVQSIGGDLYLPRDTRGSAIRGVADGPTYSVGDEVLPAAAATDVFALYGSATKTIYIRRIVMTTEQPSGVFTQDPIFVIKRTAANTGGVSTNPPAVPHDSASAAATAVFFRYTANPAGLGLGAGIIAARVMGGSAAYTRHHYELSFESEPIILRGVLEGISINLNGYQPAYVTAEFTWSEN